MANNRPFGLTTHAGSLPDSTIIAVSGPLVLEHLFRFQEVWRETKSSVLIFDLSATDYMDSAAIGSLVNAHVHCLNKGHKMALAGASHRLLQILAVTKVDSLFRFYPNVKSAESALAGARCARAD
jgi:anti-sigma B factor antagonist